MARINDETHGILDRLDLQERYAFRFAAPRQVSAGLVSLLNDEFQFEKSKSNTYALPGASLSLDSRRISPYFSRPVVDDVTLNIHDVNHARLQQLVDSISNYFSNQKVSFSCVRGRSKELY